MNYTTKQWKRLNKTIWHKHFHLNVFICQIYHQSRISWVCMWAESSCTVYPSFVFVLWTLSVVYRKIKTCMLLESIDRFQHCFRNNLHLCWLCVFDLHHIPNTWEHPVTVLSLLCDRVVCFIKSQRNREALCLLTTYTWDWLNWPVQSHDCIEA